MLFPLGFHPQAGWSLLVAIAILRSTCTSQCRGPVSNTSKAVETVWAARASPNPKDWKHLPQFSVTRKTTLKPESVNLKYFTSRDPTPNSHNFWHNLTNSFCLDISSDVGITAGSGPVHQIWSSQPTGTVTRRSWEAKEEGREERRKKSRERKERKYRK